LMERIEETEICRDPLCTLRKRRFAGHAKKSEICLHSKEIFTKGAGERDYIEPHGKESWVDKKVKVCKE
jgi:hypothetical protein